MPRYVDGFVIPIPKKEVAAYKKIARKAGKLWIEHGALAYHESVGEDLKLKFGTPFGKLTNTKPTETVIFAWIVYKSRAHRDRVNKAVMADPRLNAMCGPDNVPFDTKRMSYGGFEMLVDMTK